MTMSFQGMYHMVRQKPLSIFQALLSLASESCVGKTTTWIFQDIVKSFIVQHCITTISHMLRHTLINVVMITPIVSLLLSSGVHFRDVEMLCEVNTFLFQLLDGMPVNKGSHYGAQFIQHGFLGVLPEWVWLIAIRDKTSSYEGDGILQCHPLSVPQIVQLDDDIARNSRVVAHSLRCTISTY